MTDTLTLKKEYTSSTGRKYALKIQSYCGNDDKKEGIYLFVEDPHTSELKPNMTWNTPFRDSQEFYQFSADLVKRLSAAGFPHDDSANFCNRCTPKAQPREHDQKNNTAKLWYLYSQGVPDLKAKINKAFGDLPDLPPLNKAVEDTTSDKTNSSQSAIPDNFANAGDFTKLPTKENGVVDLS